MAFRSVQVSVHYPAAVQLLDSLSAQLQLKLSDQEEHHIFAGISSQHGGGGGSGGGSCGDVAVCSVFNLTATPSDHQSQWIADQKLLVSAAKIVCNSGETTTTKVVVDLESAVAAAAQQQETVEPTGRNFGCTADFLMKNGKLCFLIYLMVFVIYIRIITASPVGRHGLLLRIGIVLVPV
jgi:hypothetical protein